MFDATSGGLRPEMDRGDGLHLSAMGARVLGRLIAGARCCDLEGASGPGIEDLGLSVHSTPRATARTNASPRARVHCTADFANEVMRCRCRQRGGPTTDPPREAAANAGRALGSPGS